MNKKDTKIIFRNGDFYLTQIDDIHTPENLAQRMSGHGYIICRDNRWGKKRVLVINLHDVQCIVIDEVE